MIYNRTHKDNRCRYSINTFMLTTAKTGLAFLRISIQPQIPQENISRKYVEQNQTHNSHSNIL